MGILEFIELQFDFGMKTNQILDELLKIIDFRAFTGTLVEFQLDVIKRLDDVQRHIIG